MMLDPLFLQLLISFKIVYSISEWKALEFDLE